MKIFHLVRKEDVSGVSGTGIVAEGVEFADGAVVMQWQVPLQHTGGLSIFKSIEDVRRIHGHENRTVVIFAITPEIW